MRSFRCASNVAFALFAITNGTGSGFSGAHAQEKTIIAPNKRTVIDAIRAVDSPSEKDLEWASSFLEIQIANKPDDSLAYCVLAILQVRMLDFEKALQSLNLASTKEASEFTRSTVGKFKLLCAINTNDKELANKLFKQLLDASQRESISAPVRKSCAEWLGEIIGTLHCEESQSPIAQETLESARRTMVATPEASIANAYEHQYGLARARSEKIRVALNRYLQLGDAAMKELEFAMEMQWMELEKDLSVAVKEKRAFSDENLAAVKALKSQMGVVRERIRDIERQWALPTPGMPAAVAMPILPRRELIYVDLFQVRIVTEFINGRRYDYQVQERRPIYDVEAERDSIYQGQMSFYNTQMSFYQQYQKNFAEWSRQDTERRRLLSQQRTEQEKQLTEFRTRLDLLEDIKKENAGGNVDIKKSIAQLKDELQSIRDVLSAAAKGKPHLALRINKLDGWLITEEKNRLLKVFQGQL
ncbi:MAG: hypothetical protein ACOVLE_05205 [Pirellula staleyi]